MTNHFNLINYYLYFIKFEETSSLSHNDNTGSPTLPVQNAKASEYRDLLCQVMKYILLLHKNQCL